MPTIQVRTDNDVIEIEADESQIKCLDGNEELTDGDRISAQYMDYWED